MSLEGLEMCLKEISTSLPAAGRLNLTFSSEKSNRTKQDSIEILCAASLDT